MSAPTAQPSATPIPPKRIWVQPTRRGAELVLLLLACLVGAGAYLAVTVGTGQDLESVEAVPIIALTVMALLAHVGVQIFARYADPLILPIAVVLNFLGLAMIHRLDIAAEQRANQLGSDPPQPDVPAQLTWMLLGVALFILVLVIVRDHRGLQRYTYTALFLGIILLLLPLLPGIGASINGSRLWLRIAGFSFQPAEGAKILFAIFFAGYLVVKRDSLALVRSKFLGLEIPRPRDMGPLFIGWGVSLAILVFERDLGTSLMFFGLFVTMLYVSTQRASWLVLGGTLFLAGAILANFFFFHVQTRVQIWLDPFADATGSGLQIVQSLFGLANGGILGTGLGQGYPQLVPFAKTDFILVALGEELGLVGLFAIFLLYAILVQRAFRTSVAVRDAFGSLLATGIGMVLALQVFIVAGGVTKLIPLTGLTTPFLAYGGSSLVANWVMLALLLRISDNARRPDPIAPQDALSPGNEADVE